MAWETFINVYCLAARDPFDISGLSAMTEVDFASRENSLFQSSYCRLGRLGHPEEILFNIPACDPVTSSPYNRRVSEKWRSTSAHGCKTRNVAAEIR